MSENDAYYACHSSYSFGNPRGFDVAGSSNEGTEKDTNTSVCGNPPPGSSATGAWGFLDTLNYYINPRNAGVTINHPYAQALRMTRNLINSTKATQTEEAYLKKETYTYSENEKRTYLDNAEQGVDDKNKNEYLSYSFGRQKMYKNHDIKTLRDSITYFRLSAQLKKLEESLEDFRRNKKNKEDHEECFNRIDKEIQKLSIKYHPDKVKNRGGTEKDIARAQKQQTALNSTRTALKLLNSAFLEDISTEHKFEFYMKLNIDSLCNENEMQYRIFEVILKIGIISRIKQQNIISEIRKFLEESKKCVSSYLDKEKEFEKHRDLALYHLKCCIKGFKKLFKELEEVKEECKSEENNEHILSLIQKMASDSKRDLMLLKSLKKSAKASFKGRYEFFSPREDMDSYFVLPLVCYMNVISMCNVMMRNSSFFDLKYNAFMNEKDPYDNDNLRYLMHPYYLTSYCSGNRYHEEIVLKIMGKNKLIEQGLKIQVSKVEIESVFYEIIREINVFLEDKFIIEDYASTMPTNLLILDFKKCIEMMSEFDQKEKKLSKGIEEFQKKTEEMDEKYEKLDKMMKAAEKMNQKVEERLEQNKKFRENFSNIFSDYNEE